MNIVTSEAYFRQRVIRYSQKHGVTADSTDFIEVVKQSTNGN